MFIVPGVILVIIPGIFISQYIIISEKKEMISMERMKNYLSMLSESITVTKLDGLLAVLTALLAGCVIGMVISPRKNQTFGCGNGCHRHFYREEDECEEE